MNLVWNPDKEIGPATTQELADEIEKEHKLYTKRAFFFGHRCLWGVIDNHDFLGCRRDLLRISVHTLVLHGLGPLDNDNFKGTPQERCTEMVMRLRAIP